MGDLAKELDLEGSESSQAESLELEGAERAAPEAPVPAKPKPVDPGTGLDTASDFGVGVGSGASFDFDDEIVAGVKSVGEFMTQLGGGQGVEAAKSKGGQEYVKGREEYRVRKKLAETRSPTANLAGKLTGTVASSALVPGGAASGALRVGGRLAAEGAAMGLGASEADLTKGEFKQAAKDTAAGAGTGLLLGTAARGGTKLVGQGLQQAGRLAPGLKKVAQNLKIRATGQDVAKVADRPGGVSGAAEALEARGVGGPLAWKGKIAKQAKIANEQIEAERKPLVKQLSAMGATAQGKKIAEQIRGEAAKLKPNLRPRGAQAQAAAPVSAEKTIAGGGRVRGPKPGSPEAVIAKAEQETTESELNQAQRRFLENEAQAIEQAGDIPFSEANRLRGQYGAQAKFGQDTAGQAQKAGNAIVHKAINDAMEYGAGKAELAAGATPVLGRQFRQLGQQQMHVIDAMKAARKASAKGANASRLGVSDIVAGVGGAVAGAGGGLLSGGAAGLGLWAGRQALKPVEHSLAGAAFSGASKTAAATGRLGESLEAPLAQKGILRHVSPASMAGDINARAAQEAQAQESSERVKEAFLQGGEPAAAQAHYEEAMKNPAYRSQTSETQ